MQLKKNVKLNGIKPEIMVAIMIANEVYQKNDSELIITSICDGKHGTGSLHYAGLGFDCRTRHLPLGKDKDIVHALKLRLTDEFDVVLEPTHIHIEFQPK